MVIAVFFRRFFRACCCRDISTSAFMNHSARAFSSATKSWSTASSHAMRSSYDIAFHWFRFAPSLVMYGSKVAMTRWMARCAMKYQLVNGLS